MLQLNSGNVVEFRKRDPTFPAVSQGILVPHVTMASPAYKAGLRPGDVITGNDPLKHPCTKTGLRPKGRFCVLFEG